MASRYTFWIGHTGSLAHAMAGEKERCLEAGMDDNITKPIRPEQLVEVLNRYSLVTSTEEGR